MSYSLREVSAMLGLSPATIRAWAAKGLIEPQRGVRGTLEFGFLDLVVLRTAGELAAARIPRRKVQRILMRLREQLPEGKSLTGVRIAAEGERIVVRDGGSVWNPESGQALFDFSVAELRERSEALVRTHAPREAAAEEWFERAALLEERSVDEAKEAYRRAIEADPAHADAHVNLGRILHEEGDPSAAETLYRSALEMDQDHETAIFNLGVALEDLGRDREAAEAYRRALDLDPENAEAHYNLAGLYERRGEKHEAIQHLKIYRSLQSGE